VPCSYRVYNTVDKAVSNTQFIQIQQTIITDAARNIVGWKAKDLIHGIQKLIHFHVLISGIPAVWLCSLAALDVMFAIPELNTG
jgi:hypothetical protein